MLVWSLFPSALHYLRTSLAVTIWIDEKNDLILLNLSSTWIKILNSGPCNLSWNEIQLNSDLLEF
jgi:hypothetical protein